jgi:glyoxylase-like metal-dependent hydrolase (beta-lactamase superfamily II)
LPALPPGVTVFERGWLSANNILFAGPHGTALVDSGYWTHAQQTLALVASELGDRQLDVLVNTHLHSDHCGGNSELQARYPRARTLIPPGMAESVRNWDPVALTYVPTGQHCPRFRIHGVLAPGEEIELGAQSWEVHAAPGHDPHSIILFEPVSRTLVSADALWENGFGVVFPELEGDSGFDEVCATLDLIERLRPSLVIPGHGSPFTDAQGAIETCRRRLEGFLRDPRRHASHAARVLLKFKLLELQHMEIDAATDWVAATEYFGIVHRRWFATTPMKQWVEQLADALARSGAARREGTALINT